MNSQVIVKRGEISYKPFCIKSQESRFASKSRDAERLRGLYERCK